MGKSKRKSKSSNQALIWTARLAGAGVLIALLVVAGLDFAIKNKAEQTALAWRSLIRERGERITRLDEFEELKVGDPVELEGKKVKHWDVKVYRWKRWFRFLGDWDIHVEYHKPTGTVHAVTPQW